MDTFFQDPQSISNLLSLEDDALLEEIQKVTFRYFWDFGHPHSGLARERNTSGDLVTSGGSGFGIMALIVGIHRNFITREEGLARITKMVTFLENADRFHGAWPHWMDGNTGEVIPFSPRDNGGDLVETSFLMQGLLTARSFFDGDDPSETELRASITSLWESVDWNWYRKQVQTQLFWHWSPTFGFEINLPIRGWNETMIAYILAVASPTHRVPPNLYEKGWAGNNYENDKTFYGYKLEVGNGTGGPLFFTHYSFLGFDPRAKRDQYANYFFQGVNQTLVNRAYCIENPEGFVGYGSNCWGLTASDDPDGYKAHAPDLQADNGTITPTAAISSIPYTPEESIGVIRHLLATYGDKVWGEMGFYDAFNPSRNWFADSYLAIDQGPIICMIENYRSGLLWEYFMRNEEILEAAQAVGFVEDSATTQLQETFLSQVKMYPNPTIESMVVEGNNQSGDLKNVIAIDEMGRAIDMSFEKVDNNKYVVFMNKVPSGMYFVKVMFEKGVYFEKILH